MSTENPTKPHNEEMLGAPNKEQNITEPQEINPNDFKSIKDYLELERKLNFLTLHSGETIEQKAQFKQQQIQEGKLKVITIRNQKGEMVASGVVVLKNGTMGKIVSEEVGQEEAWNAGVASIQSGCGKEIVKQQDRLAAESGKKSILTDIVNNNHQSMRVIMKAGYRLESIDKRSDETDYRYRKNLTKEGDNLIEAVKNKNWIEEVIENRLDLFSEKIDDSTPEQILIEPENVEQVKQALENNYKGIHLLTLNDFENFNPKPIDKNLIVFIKPQETAL